MTQKYLLVAILIAVAAAGYDHTFAEDIFQFSRIAYCKEEIIKSWDCESCKRHPNFRHLQVFYNDSHHAQGYCGYDPDLNKIVVAIRGSVDQKNYAVDLDYSQTDYDRCKGCGVHRGFYATYENLANNLLACSYTLRSEYPDAKIIVTGHSLGAAQSTFAAVEIKQLLGRSDVLEAFHIYGTPRIGNEAFATFVENELAGVYVVRVTRDRDTFHHLPTQSQGFSHFGNEIFYNDEFTSYKICSGREDSQVLLYQNQLTQITRNIGQVSQTLNTKFQRLIQFIIFFKLSSENQSRFKQNQFIALGCAIEILSENINGQLQIQVDSSV